MKFTLTTLILSLGLNLLSQVNPIGVKCGAEFSLILAENGSLWSCGNNGNGQLGLGNTTTFSTPQIIGLDTGWEKIATGGFHSLAIKNDGTLWSWGLNGSGQLGIGNTTDQNQPTQVGTDTDWDKIYAGTGFSIAIKEDSTLYCWGDNTNGQLGNGTTNPANSPQLLNTEKWIAADGGGGHSLFLRADGTLFSAGANFTGQLGDSTTTNSNLPIQVYGSHIFKSVSAGFEFSMAIDENNKLYTWGFNGQNQLGYLTPSTSGIYPQPVLPMEDIKMISAGSNFAFAITNVDLLFGMGFNGLGQLGAVTNTNSEAVQIGIDTWSTISAAKGTNFNGTVVGSHTLGIKNNETFICYTGSNYIGQHGNGNQGNTSIFECGTTLVGLTEDEAKLFSVYPNPSNGVFTITSDIQNNTDFTIYDSQGVVIKKGTITDFTKKLDLSNFNKGIYILSLNGKQKRLILN